MSTLMNWRGAPMISMVSERPIRHLTISFVTSLCSGTTHFSSHHNVESYFSCPHVLIGAQMKAVAVEAGMLALRREGTIIKVRYLVCSVEHSMRMVRRVGITV